jgi:hypothetical protein
MSTEAPKGDGGSAGGAPVPRARFRTTIVRSGKTATGIEVPAKIVASLGESRRPPVRVTINGHTYRSTIAVMGGVFMVGVSAENRERAGVAGGDEVDVELDLDTAPREVTVPADFADALDRNPGAKERFDSLSHSHKQAHVLSVESAKKAETRHRRIAKAVSALTGSGS